MMSVMTAQPPLNLVAEPRPVPVGPAAALVEDDTGGRVYVYGILVHCWQAGEEDLRRLAAVQLVTTKTATVGDVTFAFGVQQVTLWRWRKQLNQHGLVGLVSEKRGPKGPSLVTPEVEAEILTRRAKGETLREIAQATGVSISTAARISKQQQLTTPQEPVAAQGNEEYIRPDPGDDDRGDDDRDDDEGGDDDAALPVLAEPAPRRAERALARTGLLDHADPVFAPAARVPLAGLFLALPALEATGLLACANLNVSCGTVSEGRRPLVAGVGEGSQF